MKKGTVTRESVVRALAGEKLHPSVPEVVVAIIHITRSPSATINDLVRVIEQDPALTNRILSIANSGFYGLDRKVRNVSEAVVLMGWNTINKKKEVPLLREIEDQSYFYFVHSYYVIPEDEGVVATTTDYGVTFVSSIHKDNIFACQFHPEKSQSLGLQILSNFGELT